MLGKKDILVIEGAKCAFSGGGMLAGRG